MTLAVARLEGKFVRGGLQGTAFAFTPQLVLTAFHCVGDLSNGQLFPGEIILHFRSGPRVATVYGKSIKLDAALLKLRDPLPDSEEPFALVADYHVHEWWASITFPARIKIEEVNGSPLTGKISGIHSTIRGGAPAIALHCDQASAGLPLKGASGAPVLVGTPAAAVGLIRYNPLSAVDANTGAVLGGGIYATGVDALAAEFPAIARHVRPGHIPAYTRDPEAERRLFSRLPIRRPSHAGMIAAAILAVVLLFGGGAYAIDRTVRHFSGTSRSATGSGDTAIVGTGPTRAAPLPGAQTTGPAPPAPALPQTTSGCTDQAFAAAITISPDHGRAGTTISVHGQCFAPGEVVVVRFHTTVIAQPNASSDGSFTASGRVPADLAPFGGHQFTVTASGKQSLDSDQQPFDLT